MQTDVTIVGMPDALRSNLKHVEHACLLLVMALKRKIVGDSSRLTESGPVKKAAARGVTVTSFDKWIAETNKQLFTSVWLKYERRKDDRHLVELMKCSVRQQFEEKFRSSKYFSDAFIVGSRNLRTHLLSKITLPLTCTYEL